MASPSQSSSLPRRLQGKKGASSTLRERGKKGSWEENIPKIFAQNTYWYYCWGPQPAEGTPAVTRRDGATLVIVDFLPMFWGYYPKHFQSALRKVLARKPIMILGFNEPDHKDQSNIPVQKALEAWRILQKVVTEQETARDILLVSPSCADPLGPWMTSFMKSFEKDRLRVDVIGVHHYGGPNVKAFQTRMQKIHEMYGRRPILITEFGVADWKAKSVDQNRFSAAKVLEFMQAVLPWMESQEWILGYSWFLAKITSPQLTCSALFDQQGKMTPLGKYYSSFRAESGVIR